MKIPRYISAALTLVCLPAFVHGLSGAAATTRPVDIETLRRQAMGPDLAVSEAALRRLQTLPTTRLVCTIVGQVLRSDRVRMEAALTGLAPAGKVAELERQLQQVRAAADANLRALDKGPTLQTAHQHYQQLMALVEQLREPYARRWLLLELAARRPRLLETWRKLAEAQNSDFAPAPEEALLRRVESALGAPPGPLYQRLAFNGGRPPAEASDVGMWFYGACRAIEAHNQSMQYLTNRAEAEALRHINLYREALGRLPMEIDARLVQSARRHSREMSELKYFAHRSPTPGMETPGQRMAAAGYPRSGYTENIAAGTRDPQHLFKLWFDSPPHHKGMVNPDAVAAAIGKWDLCWTLNMGWGPRLMGTAPEALGPATQPGHLAAQDDRLDANQPQRKVIRETRIYDPFNPDPAKRRRIEREEQ